MSVVKAKRSPSPHEFWWKMNKLKQYTYEKISHTPKRKQRWICEEIGTRTADAAYYTATADDVRVKKKEDAIQRSNLMKDAIIQLESLQPFLYIFWNIQKPETKSMEFWANSINEEMAMIAGIIAKETGEKVKYKNVKILHWKQMRECKYVSKMAEYHRYVHGKVIQVSFNCMDSHKLIELIDTAFYDVVESNWKIPETKEEYQCRTALIDDAIQKLNTSQIFNYALWNIKPFSEREMNEWAGMLDECLKLLNAVKKSDAQRFKQLK